MNRELEQLLHELRDEGSLDSAGTFSLDAAKAREKLALRQSREAGLWLVKLIQCAHLWEAVELHLRQRREQAVATLRLGNHPVDLRPWLEKVHRVEWMAHPLYGPLATAFQAALADGCDSLELGQLGLRLDPGGVQGPHQALQPLHQLELTFHYGRRQPWWNPLLHLRPPRRSLENFLAASRKAGLALPQVAMDRYPISGSQGMLQKSCGSAPNPARLERVWLSSAPARELMLYPPPLERQAAVEEVGGKIYQVLELPQSYQALRQWRHEHTNPLPRPTGKDLELWLEQLQGDGLSTPPPDTQGASLAVRGLICWNVDSHLPSALLPIKYGIVLDAMPFTSLPTGVTIWLSSPRWRTDINQKKVIQDEVCRQLGNWCLDQFEAMVAETQELLRWPERPQAQTGPLKNALIRYPQAVTGAGRSAYPA